MPGPGHPGRPVAPPDAPSPAGAAAFSEPAPTGHPAGSEPSPAAEASARLADMLVEQAEDAVEEDIGKLADVAAERDQYLDRLQRLQADFENYKKRVQRQQAEHAERAAEDLVVKLLPVLDNFDLALAHGADAVEPVHRSLMTVLQAAGLERIEPTGMPFDPNEHDAVLHEEGDAAGTPEVIEVLRAGYRWSGRVLRPAMVKVKG